MTLLFLMNNFICGLKQGFPHDLKKYDARFSGVYMHACVRAVYVIMPVHVVRCMFVCVHIF